MKTINVSFKTALVILLFGASSCNNNSSQGATGSSADSVINGATNSSISRRADSAARADSMMNKKNLSNGTSSGSAGLSASNSGSSMSNSANSDLNHTWSLVITPATSKNHLDSVEAIWKKDNIDLNISKLKYDNGNLVKIKGSVTIHTKAGNQASGEFKSENLTSIQIKVDNSPKVSIKGN